MRRTLALARPPAGTFGPKWGRRPGSGWAGSENTTDRWRPRGCSVGFGGVTRANETMMIFHFCE
eukprot:11214689-Lingulodinium_polyedra.AAC.1